MYRIGFDVGGTFTDFTLHDVASGALHHFKVPTSPADPSEGIADGLNALLSRHGIAPQEISFAGHGTTETALAQGATVLAHDPSFQEPSARRKYESQFAGAHALAATDPATLIELALKRHGHIDALVNNDAHPALRAPLAEARLDDYRAAFEAMAVAPFRLVQLVAPSMRKRKRGRIVFVSSAAPLRGSIKYRFNTNPSRMPRPPNTTNDQRQP